MVNNGNVVIDLDEIETGNHLFERTINSQRKNINGDRNSAKLK